MPASSHGRRRAELVNALKQRPASFPEADIADSTGCTLNAAARETERASTLDKAGSFADALDAGEIRPGHVDALTRAAKGLDDAQTAELYDQQDRLVDVAASSSIRDFEQHVRATALALQTEADAEARLARQTRATRLRSWVDKVDGMWNLSGRFDPITGKHLHDAIEAATRSLFVETTPATAPTDRLERQQHLHALALARLVLDDPTAPSIDRRSRNAAPIAVVDATTAIPTDGASAGPSVDWGLPIEVPTSVLRDVFGATTPDVVIVANGVVLHAPGNLHLGRTTRLANRDQRRALRGLYSTCAVPGCATHYDRCKLHHVIWWRHGGHTDLDNLLPVCQHHHTQIHDHGWNITLEPNRELTITLPDGTTLRSGPPKHSAA
ncbi:MAG: HNH endonuclease [Actinomycetota bacterium]